MISIETAKFYFPQYGCSPVFLRFLVHIDFLSRIKHLPFTPQNIYYHLHNSLTHITWYSIAYLCIFH